MAVISIWVGNFVYLIRNFTQYECRFEMYTENFGFLKIETPPNKIKFNQEQRKFTVSFTKNNSATLVRQDYLLQYKLSDGKKRSKYAINDFIRANDHFDRTGTVHSGPRQRPQPKRSQENVEKINEMLQKTEQLSMRKISCLSYNSVLLPSREFCATTPRRSSTDILLSSL